MQAAGRLHQIMPGQRFVHCACGAEVTIRMEAGVLGAEGPISAPDVMRWMMSNTVRAALGGVVL